MWPAFIAAAVASVVALAAARSGWRDLPVPARGDRRAIWATATWAFGIVLLASGIIGFRTRDDPLRPILVGAGVVILVLGLVFERLRPHRPGHRLTGRSAGGLGRPVRRLHRRLCPDRAVDPAADLLPDRPRLRTDPRGRGDDPVHGGAGRGRPGRRDPHRSRSSRGRSSSGASPRSEPATSWRPSLLGPRMPYLGFGFAMLLIGAGFVVATTVRTAIIFASVPRGLPATAAALNEVSVSMGVRAALVLVTTFVARRRDRRVRRFAGRPAACRGRCRPRRVPRLPG